MLLYDQDEVLVYVHLLFYFQLIFGGFISCKMVLLEERRSLRKVFSNKRGINAQQVTGVGVSISFLLTQFKFIFCLPIFE